MYIDRIDTASYLRSLAVRIANLHRPFSVVLPLIDSLYDVHHEWSEGKDISKAMLRLNRKLITQEGQPHEKKFIRSAQRRANLMAR